MGVPAFFRWLSRKYPSIVTNSVEQKGAQVDGVTLPVDWREPNPNGVEFDNLYLDMNGIIHPCCHPEDRPAPKNEDEMMQLIFEYIDRLMSIVRPRRLLYMAIDGVAPRAKMNQQRSRRFRSTKDGAERRAQIADVRARLEAQGVPLPAARADDEHFDSNCITPGTPFMARLAECLRYYIHQRLNTEPAWQHLIVILSDANVPGEGEHKIMDFIRRQRASPSHDPNTHHCLCGADADLIMLGLATHEPLFTIIREEFVAHQRKACEMCNQYGHELKDCQGLASEKSGDYGEVAQVAQTEKNFIFVRLNILREYLERELTMTDLPFAFDMERAIDDWVFMCFFVGNDFLPHLPSLEIREGAIDRLIKLYKAAVHRTGGYLTENGHVELSRVQLMLSELGEVEDEIFKTRQQNELNFRERNKRRKQMERRRAGTAPAWIPGGQMAPSPLGARPPPLVGARRSAYEMRMQAQQMSTSAANQSAAKQLKSLLRPVDGDAATRPTPPNDRKRNFAQVEEAPPPPPPPADDEEEVPFDEVRLWESGWKERYYQSKFEVSSDDFEFRQAVVHAYVEGLCWVLRYYYQGCASWKWFFPFHYAPFSSDFVNIGDLDIGFDPATTPFNPLEQLMGVFPAASKQHLPLSWQHLMTSADSPIVDQYPEMFTVDLNGKKFEWQGVALLPFVEEDRLLTAVKPVYPLLTSAEVERNSRGSDRVFVCQKHSAFSFFGQLYESAAEDEALTELDASLTLGLAGLVGPDAFVVKPGECVASPLAPDLPDVPANACLCARYADPLFAPGYVFEACRLAGAREPPRTLKPGDWNERRDGRYRPQVGFNRDSPRASLHAAGHRMLKAGVADYNAMPPPRGDHYGGRERGGGNYDNRHHQRAHSAHDGQRYHPYNWQQQQQRQPQWQQQQQHQGYDARQQSYHRQPQQQQQQQMYQPHDSRQQYSGQQQQEQWPTQPDRNYNRRRPNASDYF